MFSLEVWYHHCWKWTVLNDSLEKEKQVYLVSIENELQSAFSCPL